MAYEVWGCQVGRSLRLARNRPTASVPHRAPRQSLTFRIRRGAILCTLMPTPDVIEPLDGLQSTLAGFIRPLKRAGPDFDLAVKLVEAALDALGTAGTIVRHHDAPLTPAEAARFSGWLHELRGYVHAIAGWAHLLGALDDEKQRQRAREAIERSARLLEQILAEPPG